MSPFLREVNPGMYELEEPTPRSLPGTVQVMTVQFLLKDPKTHPVGTTQNFMPE